MAGEQGYLDLVREVLGSGNRREDRTGVGTFSLFGQSLRFDLEEGFPLLTTKRVFWKAVLAEILWFISGSTDVRVLQEQGVHIWDGNASRGHLDANGLHGEEEGYLGPVYGFQWRHWGAEYVGRDADYTGKGIDQLAALIARIKEKPHDRRLIMSAWNVTDLPIMALPACHVMCQFYVADGKLSCQMYQRSADLGLGVPFNIASYALLTHMIAHVCGLGVGEFIHVMGDCHCYLNHVEALQEQITRVPRPMPKLRFARTVTDIDDFKFADFILEDYNPYPKLKMGLAI